MDGLTALPRTLLLLLFLLLSPLGGWCHPMPGTEQTPEEWRFQEMMRFLKKMKTLEKYASGPVEAQRTGLAVHPVTRPQAVLTRQVASSTRRTDCFGRKMDRIGSGTGLGCKQLRS